MSRSRARARVRTAAPQNKSGSGSGRHYHLNRHLQVNSRASPCVVGKAKFRPLLTGRAPEGHFGCGTGAGLRGSAARQGRALRRHRTRANCLSGSMGSRVRPCPSRYLLEQREFVNFRLSLQLCSRGAASAAGPAARAPAAPLCRSWRRRCCSVCGHRCTSPNATGPG